MYYEIKVHTLSTFECDVCGKKTKLNTNDLRPMKIHHSISTSKILKNLKYIQTHTIYV